MKSAMNVVSLMFPNSTSARRWTGARHGSDSSQLWRRMAPAISASVAPCASGTSPAGPPRSGQSSQRFVANTRPVCGGRQLGRPARRWSSRRSSTTHSDRRRGARRWRRACRPWVSGIRTRPRATGRRPARRRGWCMHDLDRGDSNSLAREAGDERVVRTPHRVGRELALGGRGLVRGDGQRVARARKGPHPLERTRQESEVIRVKGHRDGARLLVSHDVDDRSVAIEDRDSRHFTLSHFVGMRWSLGWLTSKCHTTAANPSV